MAMKYNAWFSELDFEPERRGGKGNNFVTTIPLLFIYLFIFFFVATPHGTCDLSSQPGIEPVPTTLESQSLNHWTAREVLYSFLY